MTWLTQESYDRLKGELDQLIANRPVIAAEINDRREEGDLRENGGYHAAREEQGQEEARIRQLQELLNTAKVGEAPKQSGVALPGSVVKVDYYDDDEVDTETFLIATRQEGVNDDKLEVYSPNSPLGGALLDAKDGDDPRPTPCPTATPSRSRWSAPSPTTGSLGGRRECGSHHSSCSWRGSPKTCFSCCSTTPRPSRRSSGPAAAAARRGGPARSGLRLPRPARARR